MRTHILCHVCGDTVPKTTKLKMADKNNKTSGKKGEQLSQEKIFAMFQQLRMEQRTLAAKLTEMEAEKNEHA